jgi:hypothetical protein
MGLISIPVHSILWQRGAGGPLDQRSSALGSTAVSARAQSHLTCSGAHNVRIMPSEACSRPPRTTD